MHRSTRDLSCGPGAPLSARTWVRGLLDAGIPTGADAGEIAESAVLCVSELVTNAHQAGCTAMSLTCTVDPRVLRLSVVDNAPGLPRTGAAPKPSDVRGRGLHLIAALSSSWGVVPAAGGKETWVEFELGTPTPGYWAGGAQ
jgi:anti-sigma regulatory factor (Ser/Thr protein kinase)